MNYEELVVRVKQTMEKAKVSKTIGHIAFQFNVEGDGEGIFYLEITDGKIRVEPYEYYDRDIIIISKAEILLQMFEGTLKPRTAYANSQIKVEGNITYLDLLPLEYKGR